jgi:DNA invertase Pin-like site-specific DNA recombinase
MLDMVLKGRERSGAVHRGRLNPMARLTPENISDIRGMYADGEATTEQIASEYGITHQHAVRIVQRKAWENDREP